MKKGRRLLSLALVLVMVLTLMPTAAFAAGTDKAIQLVTSGTAVNILGAQKSNVYFGNYMQKSASSKDPIKWRVLQNKDGRLFLLSDQNLDVYRYNETYKSVTWETCSMRSWLNDTNSGFVKDAFSSKEQGTILNTTVTNANNPDYGTLGGNSTTDQVFLLSIAEATNTAYGFMNDYNATVSRESTNTAYVAAGGTISSSAMYPVNHSDAWWLRSPGNYDDDAAFVSYSGDVDSIGNYVYHELFAVRPAFNLNLTSVLFTSAATGGKTGDGALTKIGSYTGNDWKLTLRDSSRAFKVTENKAIAHSDTEIQLNYTGATTGTNEYISAILTDSSGNLLYYGRLTAVSAADGKLKVKIPADLANGTYTLKVFNEQYNGDYKTDYASAFSDVTLTVMECPSKKFTDVDITQWYHWDLDYVVSNSLMVGTAPTTFEPNSTLTRAMVVTVLYRMAGSPAVSGNPTYSDVPAAQWYSNAIKWATDKGIAYGYGGGKFGPDDPVTREQMAAFLRRYAQFKGKDVSPSGDLSGYTDAGQVSSWATDSMKWAVGNGIIVGTSTTTLEPGGTATRAQFAAIIHRYWGKLT